jgi:general stress protein 26
VTLDPQDPSSISAFVRREGRGVVATVTPEGYPEAALVGLGSLVDGTLIFNSNREARKIRNLARNDRVAVVVGVAGEVTVQFEGIATITRDEERDAYGREYDRQFPGSRALDPDFAVVVVRPSWLRVYDTATVPVSISEAVWPVAAAGSSTGCDPGTST